jgi:hypothetical protein
MGGKFFLSFFFVIILNIIFSQEIIANNSLCKKYFIERYEQKLKLSKPDAPIDIGASPPHLEIYERGEKIAGAYFVLFDKKGRSNLDAWTDKIGKDVQENHPSILEFEGKPIGENLKTRWGRYDPEEKIILASKSDPQSNLVTETELKEMRQVSMKKFESSDGREVTKKLRSWHEKHGDQKWYKGLDGLLKGADKILQENKVPDELLGKIVSVGVVKPIGEKKHVETFQGKVERIFATNGSMGEKWLKGMNFYMVIMTEKGPVTINTYKSRHNIYFLKDL